LQIRPQSNKDCCVSGHNPNRRPKNMLVLKQADEHVPSAISAIKNQHGVVVTARIINEHSKLQ